MAEIGVFYLLLSVLGIVLIVAWIILPFAIIGTKPLLRELIEEVKKANALLRREGVPTMDALPKEQKGFLQQPSDVPEDLWRRFSAMGHKVERSASGGWIVTYKSGERADLPSNTAIEALLGDLENARLA